MLEQISICLTALYLRGVPRPTQLSKRRWVRVVSTLRSADCTLKEAPTALRADGFWEEAIALETNSLVENAKRYVEEGVVLTAVDALYPSRWMERLGQSAPPVLWISGSMPHLAMLGIVGSRNIEPDVSKFAQDIGREASELDYAIVSGGAVGCDYAGASGAILAGGRAVEILPFGIDNYDRKDRCALSVCAPEEIFSTAAAMERNTLIYAAADHTVVVHARFKEGGTWIGAVEATRKHLCPLIVRDDNSQASRALIGLGATAITDPKRLAEAIEQPPTQRGLFGIG